MTIKFHPFYTPSLMTQEDLEQTIVGRENTISRIVERVKEGASTDNRYNFLVVGPRGIGKTHLLSTVYYRLKNLKKASKQLKLAWLVEDEWGISCFLDFILSILEALNKEEIEFDVKKDLNYLHTLSKDKAEIYGLELLLKYIGNKTLVILMENLNELFSGIKEDGQKKFRALIQDHSNIMLIATTQTLFGGVKLQSSPFFGFFNIEKLPSLEFDEVINLFNKIFTHQNQPSLKEFLATPGGRARIRALHHLAGGNPRIYTIFSSFINSKDVTEIFEPLLKTLDELTPYYQAKMQWISPQQKKIIEHLSKSAGALTVKEISNYCFFSHQATSSQLKILKDMGYVISKRLGSREVYYELAEPLMRYVLDLKALRGQPLRLLINFLKVWYTERELRVKLDEAKNSDRAENSYIKLALEESKDDSFLISSCLKDWEKYNELGDTLRASEVADELLAIRGEPDDYENKINLLKKTKKYDEALEVIAGTRQTPSMLLAKANILLSKTEYEKAEKVAHQALNDINFPNHKSKPVKDYLIYGLFTVLILSVEATKKYETAIKYLDEVLKYFKKRHSKDSQNQDLILALWLHWLGQNYMKLDQYKKGTKIIIEAYHIYKEHSQEQLHKEQCAETLKDLAKCYYVQKDYKKSLDYLEKSLKIYSGFCKDKNEEKLVEYIYLFSNRGLLLKKLNMDDEFIKNLNKIIDLSEIGIEKNKISEVDLCESLRERMTYWHERSKNKKVKNDIQKIKNILSNRPINSETTYLKITNSLDEIYYLRLNKNYEEDFNIIEKIIEKSELDLDDKNFLDLKFICLKDLILQDNNNYRLDKNKLDEAIIQGKSSSNRDSPIFTWALEIKLKFYLEENNYNESIKIIEDILGGNAEDPFFAVEDLIYALLKEKNINIWEKWVFKIIDTFSRNEKLEFLDFALTNSLKILKDYNYSKDLMDEWFNVWESSFREFVPRKHNFVLDILKIGIEYLVDQDEKKLLRVPVEFRNIIQETLKLKEISKN